LSCGGSPPPGCEALVHLTIGASLAPLVVVAVIGVGLVTQAPDQLWRASSGKVVLIGALVVAAVPTVVLHVHPAWVRNHPTLLLVGPYALLLVLGALAALWATDDEDNRQQHLRHPAFEHLWRRLSALRLHIAVGLVYVIAILFLPQSSGQALDTLRSWGLGDEKAAATTLLGIATCLLLCFCLLETAEPAEAAVDTEPDGDAAGPKRQFDGPVWLVVGVAIMVVGFLLVRWGPLGLGIFSLGLVVFVLGALAVVPVATPVEQDWRSWLKGFPQSTWLAILRARHLHLLSWAATDREGTATLSRLAAVLVATPLLVLSTGLASVSFDLYWVVDALDIHIAAPVALTAICLVLAAVMATTAQESELAEPDEAAGGWWADPRLAVAWAPVMAVATAVALWQRDPVVTLVAVIVTAVVPCVVYIWALLLHRNRRRSWGSALGLIAALATFVAVQADPLGTGGVFGALTFVNVGCVLLVVVGSAALRSARRYRPPHALEWVGMKSAPVLLPVLVWWVLAGLTLPASMHDIELYVREPVGGSSGPMTTPTIEDAFNAWVDAQQLKSAEPGAPIPMVVVTAHGGGMRAAYWTALVLDCVVGHEVVTGRGEDAPHTCAGPRRSPQDAQAAARRIFLVSGVSGGSVGLAAYAENLLSEHPLQDGWVEASLGGDFASPTIGWGIFHDLPNHLFGVSSASEVCRLHLGSTCLQQDRARTLEASLDQSTDNPPLLRTTWDQRRSPDPEVRAKAESVPLLVFNSTLPGGGSAVVTSAAKLGQSRVNLSATERGRGTSVMDTLPLGALETIDLLCNEKDIRISTAAFLSARFPLVSPSGRLAGSCDEMPGSEDPIVFSKACNDESRPCVMSMVDGGYLDNSGLLTTVALLPEIKRLVGEYNEKNTTDIALYVVDIDNAYKSADSSRVNPGQTTETLVPLSTLMVRGAVERFAHTRVVRSINQHCLLPIAPALHPGLLAPLGWSLSTMTQEELHLALDDPSRAGSGRSGPANNRIDNLKFLQRWLTPGRTPKAGSTNPMSECELPGSGLGIENKERR
jgi:hypothetical protein